MKKNLSALSVALLILIVLLSLSFAFFGRSKLLPCYIGRVEQCQAEESNVSLNDPTIIDKIGESIFKDKTEIGEVRLGGIPIGISLESSGIKIIGISEILTSDGVKCPAIDSDVRIGDIISTADGVEINSSARLSEVVSESNGKPMELEIIRNGTTMKKTILPVLDVLMKKYKLGLWTKEGSSGIGTLTFINENGRFASLGHPIVNPETGEIYKISGGSVYECEITGVVKGTKGTAGELRGDFLERKIGMVSQNVKIGVYGQMTDSSVIASLAKIKITSAKSVKPGKAYVYTTVDGKTPELYEAEIIKAVSQSGESDKGIVIRITDERLISKTGGIVQGMSGSPIIQDGNLVGAITHVFVNDGIKGYGVYAEFMYNRIK